MLREVNVERCKVVAINIWYFTACFLWMATGGGLLLDLYYGTV